MQFNKFFFAIMILTAFFAFSCSKEEVAEVAELIEEEPEPVETFVNGKILIKKGDLCLFGRDSKMHSVIRLSCGSDISVLEIDGVIDTKFLPDEDSLTNESSVKSAGELESAKDGEEKPFPPKGREYVHVVHDNMDFWLEKTLFALNCENAVAIEKAFLYSDSDLAQKIDSPQNPLRFAERIAVSLEENALSSAATKIFYYDTKEKSVREAFVASSSISSRIDDIVVSQIAEELKVTKRAVPRNELFARAAKYKPCKKVLAALNSQKEDKVVNNYQEVLKSMQRMSRGVNVEELLTVDQSKDPFK